MRLSRISQSRLLRKEAVTRKAMVGSLAWMLPMAWIAATPPMAPPWKARTRSYERLSNAAGLVKAYKKRFDRLPLNRSRLRWFAAAENRSFAPYDAYGHRFRYKRLDESHFLLRSFLADGVQNHPGGPADAAWSNWSRAQAKGVAYRFQAPGKAPFYPAPLLLGALSPQGRWVARLFTDEATGKKHLVVRSRQRQHLYMTARHDHVEEFFWLPGGGRIVFTATGSRRYRDGLFLWNLKQDKTDNLVDRLGEQGHKLSPIARGQKLWLSLSRVRATDGGAKITLHAAPRKGRLLSPKRFYSNAARSELLLPPPGSERSVRLLSQGGRSWQMTDSSQAPSALAAEAPLPVQAQWLELPWQGRFEDVLLRWQTYAKDWASLPVSPYSLWMLATFYGEAYGMTRHHQPEQSRILRSYGSEIARTLMSDSLAPTYLRAIGRSLYEDLMAGAVPAHTVGDLDTPPAAKADFHGPPPQIERKTSAEKQVKEKRKPKPEPKAPQEKPKNDPVSPANAPRPAPASSEPKEKEKTTQQPPSRSEPPASKPDSGAKATSPDNATPAKSRRPRPHRGGPGRPKRDIDKPSNDPQDPQAPGGPSRSPSVGPRRDSAPTPEDKTEEGHDGTN